MKIASSAIAMASQQEMTIRHSRRESLTYWQNAPSQSQGGNLSPLAPQDLISISPEAKEAASKNTDPQEVLQLSDKDRMEMELIRRMVEMLTGRKLAKFSIANFLNLRDKAAGEGIKAIQQAGQPPEQGWGMIHQVEESHYEEENTAFAAEGKVITSDGQEIDISVELSMSRQFMAENNLEIRAGDAARLTDPLVINFAGTAAQLSETKFRFDLNSDGSQEEISFVGSGLLALDKNGDGVINDGQELFGPSSGQGFTELARHDQDGNGWIDESDAIYQRLRIWSKDGDGTDQLATLGQRGVGALYLGHVASEFSVKDEANRLQGQVRSTGLYLNEDGSSGTLQQLDLAV